MRLAQWSLSLMAASGLLAAAVAGATIWLLLTDPITLADAADELKSGNAEPLVQALGAAILDALRGLFKYL
ncbi:MAG TPA: hypothetical protein VLA20_11240 [Vicinamibacterales bacterium]|nr:hypothetical protein [Vicinamibacterales bacterium]